MNRFLLTLISIILTHSCVYSQSADETEKIDRQIIYFTYNTEFSKAEDLLETQIARYSDSPKYYFLKVGTQLMKDISTADLTEVDKRREVKDSLNRQLIKYTEEILDKFEDIPQTKENKFYLGCLMGYLGRFYGVEKSWMSAFGSAKEGKNLLEEVIEEDPNYFDAYLLLGMFNYYADRMGGFIGLVAGVLGLSGDRETGLKYLQIASEKGNLTSSQANLLLAELYSRLEGNEFESLQYFEKFTNKYPLNKHFINWYCRELLSLKMADKVGEKIKNDKNGIIEPYIKGEYYHLSGKYHLAIKEFQKVLDKRNFQWRWYIRNAEFLFVLDNWLLGNQDVVESSLSTLSEEQRERFNLMTQNQKLTKELLKFESAISRMEDLGYIENFIGDPPDFAGNIYAESFYWYNRGIYYYKNEAYSEAENSFIQTRKISPEYNNVSSIKYLISLYMLTNVSKLKVEKLIEDIEDLDYESLEFRVKDLEKKYNL